MQLDKQPKLVAANLIYLHRLFQSRHTDLVKHGELFTVPGFDDYNRLIRLNSVFSSSPFGMPHDRQGKISSPLAMTAIRPWTVPQSNQRLDLVLDQRAQQLLSRPGAINMLWSGGQDSTAMVTALATQCQDPHKLRLLYSPFSTYENSKFLVWLSQNFPDIELIDISGDIYLNMVLDGTYVTGHGADELMGSLDKSFFDQGAQTNVLRPWKDFFVEQQLDTDFIDWSTEFFSGAHRPVQNLLHARWWFYTCCKLQYLNTVNSLLFGTNQSVDLDNFLAFYDCDIFESWAWHNLDSVIEDSTDYSTWKKCLRRYVYQKWPDDDYLHHTQKVNSIQLVIYRLKKQWLNDTHWIGILETGQVLRTPNLPLFSMKEWQLTYNGRYDYLWQ